MGVRILVPQGRFPLAEGVLPEVAQFGRRFQADLALLSVIVDPLDITCSHIPRPPRRPRRAMRGYPPKMGFRRWAFFRNLPGRGSTTEEAVRTAAGPIAIRAAA